MSLPLIDLRAKITHETDCVLTCMTNASGKDRSEIVREILHEWSLNKINELRLLNSALIVAGLEGIVEERRK